MKTGEKDRRLWKAAFRATLPVLAGYLVLGAGFGMVLRASGLGVLWAFLMSFLIYAGSMQFFLLGLLSGGADLVTVALSTLMVNLRHLFYGITMVDRYRDSGKKKPYLIFGLTDETYALVCEEPAGIPKEQQNTYRFLVTLFDQCYWISGSVVGAAAGSLLRINTEGIDFALTALFLVVMTDQWMKSRFHFPAVTGILSSLLCLLLFGADSFLIPAMILITAALLGSRQFLKRKEDRHE